MLPIWGLGCLRPAECSEPVVSYASGQCMSLLRLIDGFTCTNKLPHSGSPEATCRVIVGLNAETCLKLHGTSPGQHTEILHVS